MARALLANVAGGGCVWLIPGSGCESFHAPSSPPLGPVASPSPCLLHPSRPAAVRSLDCRSVTPSRGCVLILQFSARLSVTRATAPLTPHGPGGSGRWISVWRWRDEGGTQAGSPPTTALPSHRPLTHQAQASLVPCVDSRPLGSQAAANQPPRTFPPGQPLLPGAQTPEETGLLRLVGPFPSLSGPLGAVFRGVTNGPPCHPPPGARVLPGSRPWPGLPA